MSNGGRKCFDWSEEDTVSFSLLFSKKSILCDTANNTVLIQGLETCQHMNTQVLLLTPGKY